MVELARIFGGKGLTRTAMKLSDFDFSLPPELIAKSPAEKRTDSRMMIVNRQHAEIRHDRFHSFVDNLMPGDLLVMNDTRVIPARLFGRKETGGKVEVFLTEQLDSEAKEWECLTKSSRAVKIGTKLIFAEGLVGEIFAGATPPKARIRFSYDGNVAEILDRIGHIPLPPYIDRDDTAVDRERYQTVFARNEGALAAPTAGLHFSDETLEKLTSVGVDVRYITLHVGIGTFLPVRVENVLEHQMHEERYSVSLETAAAINAAKQDGRRIVAVGTTVARTLESVSNESTGLISSGGGKTGIFIYPGYKFKTVDMLLTNFHLPQSTLLMLVSAFAGREFVMEAYRQAIEEKYRFYSYGDCMLIQ